MGKIIITDTSLRDGNHSVKHQFSVEDVKRVVMALDEAGIDIIELGHGDGLTGFTINYGFSKESDMDLIKAASGVVKNAKIAVLLLPGIGTVPDMKKAYEYGARVVRVATHVTEADISMEHIEKSKEMGYFTVGFLMMAHRASVERVVEEAKKMESYGADVVYATDSAGAMLPNDVVEKITALKESLKIPVGFHSHNNLGLAIGNSLAALESGATYIDGSLGGLGAGAGNTATEILERSAKFKMVGGILGDYKIFITNENICIDVNSGEHIVQGMSRVNGRHPMNGCSGGGCGVCRIKILKGEYSTKKMSKKQISDFDESYGFALGCRVFPKSDMEIEYVGLKTIT